MPFTKQLIEWYKIHHRKLPWRETRNPYYILLSEIILQQTRVNQGLPYYKAFIKKYPTIKHLALASEQEVLRLWQGLGYYTRACNLHKAVKQIYFNNNNNFPNTYTDILKLPGVGKYTAAAIASFAFNQPIALIDGNVIRVLSRVFTINKLPTTSNGYSIFFNKAQSLIDKKEPALFNQAIMEFGALQCVKHNPDCKKCILKEYCKAFKKNVVKNFPIQKTKSNLRKRFFYYFYIHNNTYTWLAKRTKNDIWKNLYELPLIETKTHTKVEKILNHHIFKEWLKNYPYTIITIKKNITHKLSHQQINATFISVKTNAEYINSAFKKYKLSQIKQLPMSKLIENFFAKKFEI